MKITLVFFFLLCFGLADCYSQVQPTMPPSPAATGFVKYGDNPVSFHTGTPEISVPLYEVNLHGLTIPITLSYNPQNIQVETVPSDVGLGWDLNFGGVITRAVNDSPDDARRDYCNAVEDYDESIIGEPVGNFGVCKWGYLYAIEESEPFDWNANYFGTSTYNLNLDEIYLNRSTVSPRDAIFGHLGISLWGEIQHDGFDQEENVLRLINARQTNDIAMFVDLEPDIFYFNFPGYSGKFVFDVENGYPQIKPIPYQDLKFAYQTDQTTGKLIGFTVIDSQGNEFLFQEVETTAAIDEPRFGYLRRRSYNSAWWLTRINCPNGDFLNYTYANERFRNLHEAFVSEVTAVRQVYAGSKPLSELNRGLHSQLMVNDTKRVQSISNDNIQIEFGADNDREDLRPGSTAKAITRVTISTKPNPAAINRLKEYKLEYDYFLTDENRPVGFARLGEPEFNETKRLRLRSVQEFGNANNDSAPKYSFEYRYYDFGAGNLKKFPNRHSFNQDLWGYANGASNVVLFPQEHIYPDHYPKGDLRMFSVYPKNTFTGRHFLTIGGDRLPNPDYLDIGVLTKINYPTGGSTAYEYEPHRFMLDGEEQIGGGLRIKAITKFDGPAKAMRFHYTYTQAGPGNLTSGKIVALPMFVTLPFSRFLTNLESAPGLSEEQALKWFSTFYAYSISELGRTAGSNVGYTRVVEGMTSDNDESFDNGFSEYTYSFPAAFGELNDVESDGCSIASNGTCDGLYTTTRVHNFFMNGDSRELARLEYYPESALSFLSPPNPIYEWNRGLLLTKTLYDKNFNKVQEEIYSYKLYFPSGETAPKKVYGLKISQFDPFTSFANDPLGGTVARNFAFRVAKYELLTDVAKVPSITTVRYYGNSSSEFRSHTTTQEYGGHKHMNPTRITKTSSNGNTLLTTISYPFDYGLNGPVAPGAGVYSLRIKNISSTPVETSNYIVDHGVQYLKNSTLTLYDLSNSRPVLVKVLSLETDKLLTDFVPSYIDFSGLFRIDNRYTERLYFGRYDDRGNPLQIEDKRSGITTSYVWGYDKQLIIAKVVNATYDAVEAQVGTTYISHIGKGYYTIPSGAGVGYQTVLPSQIKEWLTPVRVNLPGCFLNIGTYDNLFRVESQIDPNGRTSYFGYDGMNRLKVTKDHDGNVINMFDYHFRKVN